MARRGVVVLAVLVLASLCICHAAAASQPHKAAQDKHRNVQKNVKPAPRAHAPKPAAKPAAGRRNLLQWGGGARSESKVDSMTLSAISMNEGTSKVANALSSLTAASNHRFDRWTGRNLLQWGGGARSESKVDRMTLSAISMNEGSSKVANALSSISSSINNRFNGRALKQQANDDMNAAAEKVFNTVYNMDREVKSQFNGRNLKQQANDDMNAAAEKVFNTVYNMDRDAKAKFTGRNLKQQANDDMNAAAEKVFNTVYNMDREVKSQFTGRNLKQQANDDMNAAAEKVFNTVYNMDRDAKAKFTGRNLKQQLKSIDRMAQNTIAINEASSKVAQATYNLLSETKARFASPRF